MAGTPLQKSCEDVQALRARTKTKFFSWKSFKGFASVKNGQNREGKRATITGDEIMDIVTENQNDAEGFKRARARSSTEFRNKLCQQMVSEFISSSTDGVITEVTKYTVGQFESMVW